MRKCLVIGGTGFIGSSLVGFLKKKNRQVKVLSNIPSTVKHCDVEYIHGDYGDIELVKTLLNDCEEIIHLAHSSLKMSINQNIISDIHRNLLPTITLLDACQQVKNIKKVIFVSSGGTVYGLQHTKIIDETHATDPISSYGVIKVTIEKYARLFYYQNQLPVIIIRPSNGYGPGQIPFAGQGFIATALASVLQSKPITIFGDGSTIRDYIYINDLAEGIIAALDFGLPGEIYNIGSGQGYSNIQIVEEIIRPLAKKEGLDLQINFQPSRGFDVPSNILSYEKLHAISGWSPQMSFEEGIHSTWKWLKDNYSFIK
jgi:UDP-glucose 4-epimerase